MKIGEISEVSGFPSVVYENAAYPIYISHVPILGCLSGVRFVRVSRRPH